MNTQYPMKKQAEQLAAQGRYGDTRLLHVNEIELEGLASLVPGGLTTNPETGQPEAFAFLIPMLASGIGAAAGWGTIGTAALSGAMTAAATGDIKRGLASAVMGAGIGSALGAAGEAGAEAAAEAAATEAAAEATASTVVEEQAADLISQGLGETIPTDQLAISNMAPSDGSSISDMFAGESLPSTAINPTAAEVAAAQTQTAPQGWMAQAGQRMKNTFTGEGGEQILPNLTKQSSLLPIALGGGQLEAMEQQEDWDKQAKKLTAERDAEGEAALDRAYGNLQQGYAAAGHQPGLSPYRKYMSNNLPPPRGYGSGGMIKYNGRSYTPDQLMDMFGGGRYGGGGGYGGIDPVTVQKNLRHTPVAAPSDYMHGFNPEFDHFQRLEEGEAPTIPGYTSPEQSSGGMYSGTINRFMGANAPQQTPVNPVAPQQGGFFGENIPPDDMGPMPPGNQPPPNQPPPGDGDAATHPPPGRGGRGGGMGGGPGQPRRQRHAEGGDVKLMTAAGPMEIAGGGIAELPNAFNATQEAGGTVEPTGEDVRAVAMAVIRGGEGADVVIDRFIKQYGVETFRRVREMVLQAAAGGNAQTEGMIKGQGGGMDDQVMGTIGGQEGVAVSPGEYIVPADVVSGLGDGSSDAGASELDNMSERVRMARGGTAQQPPPFDATKVMPR